MPEKDQKPNPKSAIGFLASNTLAVYLLIAITLACLAGTLLPQKGVTLKFEQYHLLMQKPIWPILDRLGFLDVFRSVWFMFLVAMMMINLTLCTWFGIGRINRRLQSAKKSINEKSAKAYPVWRIWRNKSLSSEQARQIMETLGPVKTTTEDDAKVLTMLKGGWARFSPFVVHLSIFIIVISVMVDVLFGMEGFMNIPKGQSTDVFSVPSMTGKAQRYRLPFEVRCDDFQIELYPGSNRPKDYKSKLVIVENGQEKISKTIEVNTPLQWEGFRLFQSSYGQTGGEAKLKVTRRFDNKSAIITVPPIQSASIPDFETDSAEGTDAPGLGDFRMLRITPDLQGNGPAAQIDLLRDGPGDPFWIFQRAPHYDDNRNGPYRFELAGVETGYYTGIMIVRKPGASGLWVGSALFMIAVTIGFFTAFRQAKMRITKDTVIFAGRADRNKEPWQAKLDQTAAALEEILGPPEEKSNT